MRILKEKDYFAEGQIECEMTHGILFVLLAFLFIWLGSLIWWASPLFFVGAILLFYLGLKAFNNSIKWRRGIEGKKKVTDALKELDDSYILINGALLPRKGGQVNHVLLGPAGIFVITTKNYGGSLRCYGEDWFKKGRIKEYQIRSISNQAKIYTQDIKDVADDVHADDYPIKKVESVLVFTNPNVKLDLYKPTVPVITVGKLCDFIKSSQSEISLPPNILRDIADTILHYSFLVRSSIILCWEPDDIE